MNKVLFVSPYGIGDCLCSLPLAAALRSRYRCSLVYVVNKRALPVLIGNPNIERILIYERDDFAAAQKKSLMKWLAKGMGFIQDIRSQQADIAVDLSMNAGLGFCVLAAGVPKRVGFDYKRRGIFLNRKLPFDGFNENVALEIFKLFPLIVDDLEAKTSNIIPTKYYPRIYLQEEEREFAEYFYNNLGLECANRRTKVIAVFPGGGSSWGRTGHIKRWPAVYYNQLIRMLAKEGFVVFVMGDKRDKQEIGLDTDIRLTKSVFDMRGLLTLREAFAVVARADAAVCNDGGPAHFSCALGVKTAVIMGPVPEGVYAPFAPEERLSVIVSDEADCRPCYHRFRMPECPNEFRCLKSISPERVFKTVQDFLCSQTQ